MGCKAREGGSYNTACGITCQGIEQSRWFLKCIPKTAACHEGYASEYYGRCREQAERHGLQFLKKLGHVASIEANAIAKAMESKRFESSPSFPRYLIALITFSLKMEIDSMKTM